MRRMKIMVCLLGLAASSACDERRGSATIEEEIERLRALGYVGEAETGFADGRSGVVVHEPGRASAGFTHFTNSGGCSAHLVDMNGKLVHAWSHHPCHQWDNTFLQPDGSLFALHQLEPEEPTPYDNMRARHLLKLDATGKLVWMRQLPVHHDVEALPGGRLAVLTYRHRLFGEVDEQVTVRDNFITILDSEGAVLEQASITDMLLAAGPAFGLKKVKTRMAELMLEIDLLHANSIQWINHPELAARHPMFAGEHVLACVRNQDRLVVFDWTAKRLVWSWGRGELSMPHDAQVLPNGNFLVFDNGVATKRSRVVELDPLQRRIVWQYPPGDENLFYSKSRGSAQRLANGNTLITDAEHSTSFEVTPSGEKVWEFRNPNVGAKGRPFTMTRSRRYVPSKPDSWIPGVRVD
jgi:hypothetical protein